MPKYLYLKKINRNILTIFIILWHHHLIVLQPSVVYNIWQYSTWFLHHTAQWCKIRGRKEQYEKFLKKMNFLQGCCCFTFTFPRPNQFSVKRKPKKPSVWIWKLLSLYIHQGMEILFISWKIPVFYFILKWYNKAERLRDYLEFWVIRSHLIDLEDAFGMHIEKHKIILRQKYQLFIFFYHCDVKLAYVGFLHSSPSAINHLFYLITLGEGGETPGFCSTWNGLMLSTPRKRYPIFLLRFIIPTSLRSSRIYTNQPHSDFPSWELLKYCWAEKA